MKKQLQGNWFALLYLILFAAVVQFLAQGREPDVPYVSTPAEVVAEMLKLASVSKGDVVYDLGCGDGRIVIAAVKMGARAVGVDINPERIQESRENAKKAGVTDRVKFIEGDLFEADISEATPEVAAETPARPQARHAHRLTQLRHGRLEARENRAHRRSHPLLLDGPGSGEESKAVAVGKAPRTKRQAASTHAQLSRFVKLTTFESGRSASAAPSANTRGDRMRPSTTPGAPAAGG